MSEATVHRVRWDDLERYQVLLYDLPEIPASLRVFDGRPKADWWEAQTVYSDSPRLEAPDIWHLVGVATIVVSPDVASELASFFIPVGELLPLRMSGTNEELLALNVLRDVDCLNPAAYKLEDLELYTDFVEHRLPESGLFKIPQIDEVEIFYLERDDDASSLREVIDGGGYTGITFEPVWSNDGAVQPVNVLGL